MSRFPQGPALKRVLRWTPTISVPLGGTAYAWVTLTLTLPETVDWTKAILVINGNSFGREVGASGPFGVQWRPGADGNSATLYVKCNSTGTKSWTPECELWLLDDGYFAYHLYGNWDTTAAAGNFYTQTATCGDALAAARGHMWLINMCCSYATACICSDNAYISDTDTPFRDAGNNSCLHYKDGYGNSNIFYSFTYVYKK